MDDHQQGELAQLTDHLIDVKRWEPIGGIELTDEVLVTIAANASIPVLALDLDVYRGVQSIIVRPGARASSGEHAGPASGVIAAGNMLIAGEAAPHAGPISISWNSALAESRRPASGRNVVIHEFAHKIDMSDGYTDGVPPARGEALDRWNEAMRAHYERSAADPSDAALRPYAWSSPAEFFAVSTEAFFCTPVALANGKPSLYEALAGFYRQDPAATTSRG